MGAIRQGHVSHVEGCAPHDLVFHETSSTSTATTIAAATAFPFAGVTDGAQTLPAADALPTYRPIAVLHDGG